MVYCLKLTPCVTKTRHMKNSFDLFFLYLLSRFFVVLEELYETNCSTKGAAQVVPFRMAQSWLWGSQIAVKKNIALLKI